MFIEINQGNFEDVAAIFRAGIQDGKASFQTTSPNWESWDKNHLDFGRIAYMNEDQMAGWGALSQKSDLDAYKGVAEVSLYVSPAFQRRGIGQKILESLINISEETGIWTLESRIMNDNIKSIALHKKCGFRIVGYREKIGNWRGKWKDVLLLERRSRKVQYQ